MRRRGYASLDGCCSGFWILAILVGFLLFELLH
jgi:hypothetical protein